jgi:hypothetical protein
LTRGTSRHVEPAPYRADADRFLATAQNVSSAKYSGSETHAIVGG